jgi:hypothetical protein
MISLLKGSRARILRMRRNTTRDFHNALADILPLYDSLKMDSEFARGASIALHRIDKNGVSTLDLDNRFSVSMWRTSGLLFQSEIRSLLYELSGYLPGGSVVVSPPELIEQKAYRSPETVLSDLREALPVPDLLDWLDGYCADGTATEVLRLYGKFFLEPPGMVERARELKVYRIKGVEMISFPLGVMTK